MFHGLLRYKKIPPEKIMDWKIRQDRQDDRTWALETLIRHEGHLDNRMYACADYLCSAGLTTDAKDVLTAWEEWKEVNPSSMPEITPL